MRLTEYIKEWLNPATANSARRRTLRLVLLASLGIHLVAGAIFGGHILWEALSREETVFEAQPPTRTYEPRKVELKVKVQQKQRSSSRPQIVPRIVSAKPSAVALPDIKVDPKLVTTTFQPKFKAVSGIGLGVGLGTGYGTSGFGQGVSQVNFFGIQAVGERIAICVDVSVSMVEAERGGPPGFLRVKQRVGDVVDSLKEGTLFNVIVFADACSALDSEKMVYANPENRTRAKQFLEPINTEGNWGHEYGNITDTQRGLKSSGGSTRLDLAITAAMLQGADTFLIISDGLPLVRHALSEQQLEAHRNRVAQWHKANAATVEAYDRAAAAAPTRKVWVPPQAARPPSKGPPREGQKADRGSPGHAGYWTEVRDIGPRPSPPGAPRPGEWTYGDFNNHISLLYKEIYVEKGLKLPRIHCIGYQIDKEGGAFLKKLAAQYKGQFRLVRRLR